MYLIDDKLAGFLVVVLGRGCRNASFSCHDGKGYFDVCMTEREFRMALERAACEYEERMEQDKKEILSYDEENGGRICFSQKRVVTRREAKDMRFMRSFVGGCEYRILTACPGYTLLGYDGAEEASYEVRADIADKVEDCLVCCLYDYKRDGNIFYVFAEPSSFEGIVRHAYAAMGYVHEDDPDVLSLDDEYCNEPADVSAFFNVSDE